MDIIKRKAELQASVENHKTAISKDLNVLASNTDKVVGGAAIAIGVALSILSLYKMLGSNKAKKRSRKSNRIISLIKQQLALYILKEGRSKIEDYINSFDETKS